MSLDLAIGEICESSSAFAQVWHSFENKTYWDQNFFFCNLTCAHWKKQICIGNQKWQKPRTCDFCKLVYLKLYVWKKQIFDPFHRFVFFKIDLSHFLLYMFAPFLLLIVSEDDYDHSSDKKFGYVFAVDTIYLLTITICCIWENIHYKLEKNWLWMHE